MLVKVCGLKNEEEIQQLSSENGIDFLGFIYVPESPRYVGRGFTNPSTAKKSVGVFRNAKLNEIRSVQERMNFEYIQLHGEESIEYCRSIGEISKVIKAFSINDEHTFEKVKAYEGYCDLFIFDTPSKLGGGSGKQFDWSILKHYKGSTPFLLSGGIGPHDIQAIKAINHDQLKGVDLNSRFELKPGNKDIALIQAFLNEYKHEVIS
tara:strand:+ start:166876 stop:167496 length:621 start_codon:yes stop_codon:yes gene_type:complete